MAFVFGIPFEWSWQGWSKYTTQGHQRSKFNFVLYFLFSYLRLIEFGLTLIDKKREKVKKKLTKEVDKNLQKCLIQTSSLL